MFTERFEPRTGATIARVRALRLEGLRKQRLVAVLAYAVTTRQLLYTGRRLEWFKCNVIRKFHRAKNKFVVTPSGTA